MPLQDAVINPIDQALENPTTFASEANKRMPEILLESAFEMMQRALKEMERGLLLGALPLADAQRIEFTLSTIKELATMLESTVPEQFLDEARRISGQRWPYPNCDE